MPLAPTSLLGLHQYVVLRFAVEKANGESYIALSAEWMNYIK